MPTKIEFSPEITKEIIELYLMGMPITDLMDKFNVSRDPIKRTLRENGISIRERGGKSKLVNHFSFDNLSPNSLYWMGYIAGDGVITKPNKGGSLSVSITSKDVEHVHKFREFMQSTHAITYIPEKNSAKIQIGSDRLASALASVGITPRKSKTLCISNKLVLDSPDFLRGVMDSDGSIFVKDNLRCYINITTASEKFAYQLKEAILSTTGAETRVVYHEPKDVFYVRTDRHRDAVAIIASLYYDGCTSLNRKQKIVDQVLGDQAKSRRGEVRVNNGQRLLIFDIDGSMTDGTVAYGNDLNRTRLFNVKDGYGTQILRENGWVLIGISGECDYAIVSRMNKLDIQFFSVNGDRLEFVRNIANRAGTTIDEIAFFGDDIIDIPIMAKSKYIGCPNDAEEFVRNFVANQKDGFIAPRNGGHGAFRDFADWLVGDKIISDLIKGALQIK